MFKTINIKTSNNRVFKSLEHDLGNVFILLYWNLFYPTTIYYIRKILTYDIMYQDFKVCAISFVNHKAFLDYDSCKDKTVLSNKIQILPCTKYVLSFIYFNSIFLVV